MLRDVENLMHQLDFGEACYAIEEHVEVTMTNKVPLDKIKKVLIEGYRVAADCEIRDIEGRLIE